MKDKVKITSLGTPEDTFLTVGGLQIPGITKITIAPIELGVDIMATVELYIDEIDLGMMVEDLEGIGIKMEK